MVFTVYHTYPVRKVYFNYFQLIFMDEKKREGAIGYRPSEEMKKIFEKFCSGPASITRPQLIEVAMQYLTSCGEVEMKEIIMSFLLNGTEAKKKHHKRTA
jgi:hypothetical protein